MTEERSKGLGIFAKMLVVMLLVTLIPTGLIWYASYREQSSLLSKGINTKLTSTADRLAQYTDQWFESHLRMLRLLASDPNVMSMKGDRHTPILKAVNEQYPYIYLAHTIRASDGMNEGRSDGKPLLYYGDRQYFKDAINPSKGYGLEVAIGKTSGLPAVIMAVPIVHDGKTVGVVAAAFLIEDISKLIVDASIGKTGFAFLLDAKGKVVAHPEKEYAKVQKDLSQHPAVLAFKNENKQPFEIDVDGKKVIAVAVGTREGMTLVAQQDMAEAILPIKQANSENATFVGASLALVVLLAFGFSRGFTDPIRRLTEAAQRMSLGEMSTDIPEGSRGDELGGLARAIDRMGVSLKLAMTQLEAPSATSTTTTTTTSTSSAPSGREVASRPPPRSSMAVPRSGVDSVAKIGSSKEKVG